ncbi:MAG: hypothetical protein DRJ47_06225 [Thermoprotei archaeon]|nr:MAG: hypothetical protein DRJ47_06225 [Thermoprotei archaeon]
MEAPQGYGRNTYDSSGNLKTVISDSDIQVPTDARNHWYEAVTLLSSAARTSSGTGDDVDVGRFIAGVICIDVTAVSGTSPSLDVIIEGKDEVSGKYKTIHSETGITATGTYWKTITLSTDPPLAFKYIRARWTISGTDPSFTFSVSMSAKA